jgi:porin
MRSTQYCGRKIVLMFVLCLAWHSPLLAKKNSHFLGPDRVTNLLNKAPSLSWQEQLKELEASTGLKLGGDYNLASFALLNNTVSERNTVGGVARLYGEYKNDELNGSLVFKIEHRKALTDTAPTDFGFANGYVGLMQSTFSDQGARLTNLYYKTALFKKRGILYAGYLDVTDYTDVHLLASPWESFSNLVFATGSATIGGLPDGALGVMAGGFANDFLYIAGGIVDANADASDPIRHPFQNGESFKSIEIGATPEEKRLFFDNVHMTLWHQSAKQADSVPEGYGAAFSLTSTFDERDYGFMRGGVSQGGGALLKRSFSLGYARLLANKNVLAGAINAGVPNEESFPGATRTQMTVEVFYRFQTGKALQITPSIQYLYHPALARSEQALIAAGLRLRAYF